VKHPIFYKNYFVNPHPAFGHLLPKLGEGEFLDAEAISKLYEKPGLLRYRSQ
jgi:hypothetical protein